MMTDRHDFSLSLSLSFSRSNERYYLPLESCVSACCNSSNTLSFLFCGNGYFVPKLLKCPLTAFSAE